MKGERRFVFNTIVVLSLNFPYKNALVVEVLTFFVKISKMYV